MAQMTSRVRKFLADGATVFQRKGVGTGVALAGNSLVFAVAFGIYKDVTDPQAFQIVPPVEPIQVSYLDNPAPVQGSWRMAARPKPDTQNAVDLQSLTDSLSEQEPDSGGFALGQTTNVWVESTIAEMGSSGPGYLMDAVSPDDFNIPEYDITPEIHEAIENASSITGIPKGVLYAFASKESNFRTAAPAKRSSALGLFQHVDKTWENTIRNLGDRYGYAQEAKAIDTSHKAKKNVMEMRKNPRHSAVMAAALLVDDRWRVERRIGRPLRIDEYYATHFLGAGNAIAFLKSLEKTPNATVKNSKTLRKAIRSNPNVFKDGGRYKTFSEVMAWMHKEMDSRLAYFTYKYDSQNPEGMAFAMDFMKREGLAARHDPERYARADTSQRYARANDPEDGDSLIRTAAFRF